MTNEKTNYADGGGVLYGKWVYITNKDEERYGDEGGIIEDISNDFGVVYYIVEFDNEETGTFLRTDFELDNDIYADGGETK